MGVYEMNCSSRKDSFEWFSGSPDQRCDACRNKPTYEIKMNMRSNWIVGYLPELDEIFICLVDQDEICYVFRRGGTDIIGFVEFMDFSKAEILGEL